MNGSVWCWGRNDYAQLGTGAIGAPSTPREVVGLSTRARHVSALGLATCVLLKDASVECWGFNAYGEIGIGRVTMDPVLAPTVPVGAIEVADLGVSAAADHTCVLRTKGVPLCWGDNWGQQFDAYETVGPISVTAPTEITALESATYLADGPFGMCAIYGDGTTRCVGHFAIGAAVTAGPDPKAFWPINGLGRSPVAVAISNGQACVLDADGSVRCWGDNTHGQLGDGTISSMTTPVYSPVRVVDLSDVVQVTCGAGQSCALIRDGSVRCWGFNGDGRLGDGTTMDRLTPVRVSGLPPVVQIVAAHWSTCALTADDRVFCWGNNSQGQLGDGTTTNALTPKELSF
jgi:alpha-tubulin suppressor-like RCC1 family protein